MSKDQGPKKKKLICVEAYRLQTNNPYTCKNMGFAFMNKTGDNRKQCNSIVFCRDYFLDIVCNHKTGGAFKGNAGSYTDYSEDPHIDFEKLRLLLFRDIEDSKQDAYKERLFSGKRALNHLEELAGFTERSKITTVNHKTNKQKVWLLTGPKEWLYYPTLISMALLVLRVISKHGPIDLTGKRPIDSFFENLYKTYREDGSTEWGKVVQDTDVNSYLGHTINHYEFTAKYWKRIFGENHEDPNIWRPADGVGFYTLAGFVNWCGKAALSNLYGNAYYEKVIPRFRRMYKEYKEGKLKD